MPDKNTAAAGLSLAATALLTVLLVSACGGSPPPSRDEATDEEAAALGRDTDKTVFDDMVQTEDKARAVEGVTLGHKQDLDHALEAQEGEETGTGDEQ